MWFISPISRSSKPLDSHKTALYEKRTDTTATDKSSLRPPGRRSNAGKEMRKEAGQIIPDNAGAAPRRV